MRLLVLEDGTFLGTVGGGCLESEVYDTALQTLADEQPRTLTFRLTEKDSPDSGLMCGGEVTIFVEPITTPALWIFGGGHVSKALDASPKAAGGGDGGEGSSDAGTHSPGTLTPQNLLRVCVGLEHPDDLREDLRQALG